MKPFRTVEGIWMTSENSFESVARRIAVGAMVAMDLDPNDFRLRDKVIIEISRTVNETLDSVQAEIEELKDEIDRLDMIVRSAQEQ